MGMVVGVMRQSTWPAMESVATWMPGQAVGCDLRLYPAQSFSDHSLGRGRRFDAMEG